MRAGTKGARRFAAQVALAWAVGLGLAACGKNPEPPAPAAPAVKLANPAPAAPVAAVQPPAAQPVVESSADKALSARVRRALDSVKGLDAGGIDVQSAGGEVKLYGTVARIPQRDEAAKAAAAVAGVKAVENHLAVVSGS